MNISIRTLIPIGMFTFGWSAPLGAQTENIWDAELSERVNSIQNCLDENYSEERTAFDKATESGDYSSTGYSQSLSRCKNLIAEPCLEYPENYSTAAMVHCTSREIEAWDERLNHYYQTLMKRLAEMDEIEPNAEYAQSLKTTQRNWIAYKDSQCNFEALKTFGGTMSSILYVACINDLVSDKTIELYLESKFYIDGDPSTM